MKDVPTLCSDLNASWINRYYVERGEGERDRADGRRTRHLADTHLCGSGGRLEVFTGTDSNSGGHTVLLFWKTHRHSRVRFRRPAASIFSGSAVQGQRRTFLQNRNRSKKDELCDLSL